MHRHFMVKVEFFCSNIMHTNSLNESVYNLESIKYRYSLFSPLGLFSCLSHRAFFSPKVAIYDYIALANFNKHDGYNIWVVQ